MCHLEWLCAGCIRCIGRERRGWQLPEGPGKWGLLCSASQRRWASKWVCCAGISRGLLKCDHFCCYIFYKITKKNQGTGALISVCMRQNMGFKSSPKLVTQKQMLMLQTSFCNKQDCTCQIMIIFSDSTCLTMCIKVVLCFDEQGILYEHGKRMLINVFQSAGGHRWKKAVKVVKCRASCCDCCDCIGPTLKGGPLAMPPLPVSLG